MRALLDRRLQMLLFVTLGTIAGFYFRPLFVQEQFFYDYTVELVHEDEEKTKLQYGIWPKLSNTNYFNEVKLQFINQKVNFVLANLTAMTLHVYREGNLALTVPIKSKGREGSWWETPSGLYSAQSKKENHFSSFGHVYMPYSIQFQGNFFIHGWPYYPDGRQVASTYSGGCIRLDDTHASEVYKLVDLGMPILVLEETEPTLPFTYSLNAPKLDTQSYMIADLESNFLLLTGSHEGMVHTDTVARLMLAVVASEYVNMEKLITVTAEALSGTQSERLVVGGSYRLYDLLFLLLQEGDSSAEQVIVHHIGKALVNTYMQEKALSLGMKKTKFGILHNGAWGNNTTTAEDAFLFMKYMADNRPFLLSISADASDMHIYGEPVFSNLEIAHPLSGMVAFKGGVFGAREDMHPQRINQEATVALAFSNQPVTGSGGGEDVIALVEVPFGNMKRTLFVASFGSSGVKKDVDSVLAFINTMYQ